MNNDMPWEKLAKYFAGELKGEEHQKMEKWIQADPAREQQVNHLYKIWKESELPPYQLDADDAWGRLSAEMDQFEQVQRQNTLVTDEIGRHNKSKVLHQIHRKQRKYLGRTHRIIAVAATILILFTSGLFTFYLATSDNADTVIAENDRRVLVTEYGERATYLLNDGSRVMLHAGSRLEIPNDYNIENRELYLEGEAYFETEHDSEKPFIVHSGNSYTRVVGTRFLVQSWEENDYETEVIVSEGRVMFGDSRSLDTSNIHETLVTENQRAVLTGTEELLVNEVTDIDWYLGWTEGRLLFENRPLQEVIPRLERWYNIEIKVEREEIAASRITAEINYSLPMSDVLAGMAMTLGVELDRENRTITFK
jgi:transmembrane sensor